MKHTVEQWFLTLHFFPIRREPLCRRRRSPELPPPLCPPQPAVQTRRRQRPQQRRQRPEQQQRRLEEEKWNIRTKLERPLEDQGPAERRQITGTFGTLEDQGLISSFFTRTTLTSIFIYIIIEEQICNYQM